MVDQRKELNDLLNVLAEKKEGLKEDDVRKYIATFQEIYQDGFRHMYSDVFSIVARVYQDDAAAVHSLSNNIRDIYNAVNQSENNDAQSKLRINIKKLYDHVNLDVTRMQYTKDRFDEWDKQQDKERRRIASQMKELEDKAGSMQRNAENMQRDYVTILGIFAAILITFVAGMTFSSSILNNIDKVSIYRLTFVMLMIALMLFNLLQVLIDFIRKMQNHDIETRSEQKLFCSKAFIINVVLFLLLVLDFFCWIFFQMGVSWLGIGRYC